MCLTTQYMTIYLVIYAFDASGDTAPTLRYSHIGHTVWVAIAQTGVESVEGAYELGIHCVSFKNSIVSNV